MDDQQLLRFSRHILLDEMAWKASRICWMHIPGNGAGGLGSPACLYLGAAGVGKLTICDHDQVDSTNPATTDCPRQRQHRHNKGNQSASACSASTLVPESKASPSAWPGEQLHQLVANADLILDCSDNFSTATQSTRFACNTANRWYPAQRCALMARSVFLT